MVGKGVVEAGIFSSLIGFWLAFIIVPQGAQTYWALPLLNERSYYVLMAALASIISSVYFSVRRMESNAIEVFGRGSLIIFGGGISCFCYIFPFVLYGGYMPRGDGITLRLISAGIGSDFLLSVILVLPFSLGSLSLYLFLQGLKVVSENNK